MTAGTKRKYQPNYIQLINQQSFILLLLCFFVTSCAGHLSITSKKIPGQIPLSFSEHAPDTIRLQHKRAWLEDNFVIKEQVSCPFFWSAREIDLSSVLQRHHVDAKKIKRMHVQIRSTFSDVLRGLIPFLSSATLEVHGYQSDE